MFWVPSILGVPVISLRLIGRAVRVVDYVSEEFGVLLKVAKINPIKLSKFEINVLFYLVYCGQSNFSWKVFHY
jgi:hypothetical protein